MKNTFLFSFVAVLTILMTLQMANVFALTGNLDATLNWVEINGIAITPANSDTVSLAGFDGETVPMKVVFTSDVDVADAKIKAWIGGVDNEISSKTIHLVNASTYPVLMSLKLPTNVDPQEDYTLYVRIETKNSGYLEEDFHFKMQRDSYVVSVLDADTEKSIKAGASLPVDVVIKNVGYERLEDVFVQVSMPQLGIVKKAYFEDLTALDNVEEDRADSAQRRVYLNIPVTAKAGLYNLIVEAYNGDTTQTIKKTVNVVGAEDFSSVIVPVSTKEVATSSRTTYDLVLVNSGNNIGVYSIIPEVVDGITVSAVETVVTVPAGSSKVVQVELKTSGRDGTYNFGVNVNSGDELVKRVALTANVVKGSIASNGTSNMTVLTIVLAIIFVVLVVVLVVLLARKPKKDELEESYY